MPNKYIWISKIFLKQEELQQKKKKSELASFIESCFCQIIHQNSGIMGIRNYGTPSNGVERKYYTLFYT